MGGSLSVLETPVLASAAGTKNKADSAGAPSAREAASLVPLPCGKRCVLLWGGAELADGEGGEATQLADVWVLHAGDDGGWSTWERVSPSGEAPPARAAAACCAAGETVVCFGGLSSSLGFLDDCWLLDMRIMRWERVAPAEGENAAWPAARDKAALVASADGSKVVLLGGFGPKESEYGDDLPEDDEFDGDDDDGEEDDSEQQRPSTEFGWFDCETLYVLDLVSKQWNLVPAKGKVPSARAAHSSCAVRGGREVVLFGGRDESGRQGDVFTLDVATMEWAQRCEGAPGPAPRSFHAMAAVPLPGAEGESAVFVLGGVDRDNGPCKGMQVLSTKTWVWNECQLQGPFPDARVSMAAAATGGALLAFGGRAGEGAATNEGYKLDLTAAAKALASAPAQAPAQAGQQAAS